MPGPKQKILIISYYWPPSGGPGVQRWLKNTKYLVKHGIQPYVLTVDEEYASYFQVDRSLESEVDPEVKVYKTRSFEILNLYKKFSKDGHLPTSGFSNAGTASLTQKMTIALRSNLFIPDPRRGWNSYAFKMAKALITSEGIDTVLTTSPPHSTQLIGLKLKRQMGIRWISDFRDPWTDIYYYANLGHSRLSSHIDRRLEKKVLREADHILTIGPGLKKLFLDKDIGIREHKISVITNGYDQQDFMSLHDEKSPEDFTITYTGTMSDNYAPDVFFRAIRAVLDENPDENINLQLIGVFSAGITELINKLGLQAHVQIIPPVSHTEAIKKMKASHALLLVIPRYSDDHLILTGKLFEYLAAGSPIICIGPENGDAASVITECDAGKTFERNQGHALKAYVNELIQRRNEAPDRQPTKVAKYSRESQTLNFIKILENQNP